MILNLRHVLTYRNETTVAVLTYWKSNYIAFSSHLGNLKDAFIPSLERKAAYNRCSKNVKDELFIKTC